VASLEKDGSEGYHFHDTELSNLYFTDFLRDYVSNMDNFKAMFANAGDSPSSDSSILKEREQRMSDAVWSFLAFVNEDLKDSCGMERKQIRDAVGGKDALSPFRYLYVGGMELLCFHSYHRQCVCAWRDRCKAEKIMVSRPMCRDLMSERHFT